MNGYEVIKELNKVKTCSEHTNDVDKRDKAIEIAKESVRKTEIMMKPKEQYYENQSGESGYNSFCPCCDARVFEISNNYCHECGQLLDWGEF